MEEVNKELLAKLNKVLRETKLFGYEAYKWQRDYHNAGAEYSERMLIAANRVGKTFSAAQEVAMHLSGNYPEWWEGKRFDKPTLVWAGSVTNESSRDISQKELLGGTGEDELGTGAIPKRCIGKVTTRQAGIGGVVDTVKVRHEPTGRYSTLVFKSYEQGWKKFQGTAPDVVWLDEEPDDMKIYTECRTRILTSKGIILVTFTPLSGLTDLVMHFREGKASTYMKNVTWDDAPHLGEKEKKELLESLPHYEREARSKGVPQLGEGRVFPVAEEEYICEPFKIPPHFAKIIGHDFGIDHPAGTAAIAHDRDKDIVYVYHSFKEANKTPPHHVSRIRSLGTWIPVSWPHDGMNRGKQDGQVLKDAYFNAGLTNMLARSARYQNDKGGAQPAEPIIIEILERMQTGRFKVFSDQSECLEELRNYHRRDGKIIARLDDIISAIKYAMMMLRYARTETEGFSTIDYPNSILSVNT